jgi:hypothetical protein
LVFAHFPATASRAGSSFSKSRGVDRRERNAERVAAQLDVHARCLDAAHQLLVGKLNQLQAGRDLLDGRKRNSQLAEFGRRFEHVVGNRGDDPPTADQVNVPQRRLRIRFRCRLGGRQRRGRGDTQRQNDRRRDCVKSVHDRRHDRCVRDRTELGCRTTEPLRS